MKAFRVKDLMINVIPTRLGGGGAGMSGPDDDVTDLNYLAPYMILPKYYAIIGELVEKRALLNKEVFDVAARELGREIVGRIAAGYCTEDMPTCRDLDGWVSRTAVVGAASSCTEDMPTCNNNIRFSMIASMPSLDFEHLAIVKELLSGLVADITKLENNRLDLARQEKDKWSPKVEGVINELNKGGK